MAEPIFKKSSRIYKPVPNETTQRNIFFQALAATVALAGIAAAGAVYSGRYRPLISHTVTYALGGTVSLLSLCLLQFFRGVNAFINKNGDRPLHLAVEKNGARKVNFLLFIGANPNAQNSNKYTPLHVSCNSLDKTNAQISITKGLIEYGADVDAASRLLETPLHRVVLNLRDNKKKKDDADVNLQQIKILRQYGANYELERDASLDNTRSSYGESTVLINPGKKPLELVPEVQPDEEELWGNIINAITD